MLASAPSVSGGNNMKKVIFWDFDGTLVKSNQSFLNALTAAFSESGLSIEEKAAMAFLRENCSWYHPERSYEKATGEAWWQELLKKLQKLSTEMGVPVDKIEKIGEAFRKNAVSYPYVLLDGAEEALKESKALGFENYILSNNFPELTDRISELGLSQYFEEVILSTNVGYEKPREEIFSYARQLAGAPDQPIMVGDNPIADIRGARDAGFLTVYLGTAPCEDADYVCRELSEIPGLLRTLSRR